jgi:hypothetical protein
VSRVLASGLQRNHLIIEIKDGPECLAAVLLQQHHVGCFSKITINLVKDDMISPFHVASVAVAFAYRRAAIGMI